MEKRNILKKVVITVLFGAFLILGVHTTDFMATVESSQDWENVSRNNPTDEVSTYGLDRPDSDEVHDLQDGRLTFKGSAEISTLYTNKFFTGAETAWYLIWNEREEDLEVKFYQRWGFWPIKSKSILTGGSGGYLNDLDAEALYYIVFYAPSDFHGYVECVD